MSKQTNQDQQIAALTARVAELERSMKVVAQLLDMTPSTDGPQIAHDPRRTETGLGPMLHSNSSFL